MVLDMLTEQVSPVSVGMAIAAIAFTIAYYFFQSRDLPPGPMGVPLLGYWPFLNTFTSHIQVENLKKKYGDVFSFTCTGTLYINLGTHKAIREAHVTKADCFSSRITNYSLFSEAFCGGVSFTNGETWKALRKFFLQVFKERLSIKYNTLGSVYDSMSLMMDHVRSKKEEPVDISELLTNECTTILRLTLFGEIGTSDERIKEVNELYAIVITSMAPANTLLTGNISKYLILPWMPEHRASMRNLIKLEKVLYKMIDEHKLTYDEENIRDIIDEYLKERNEKRSKGDPTAKYFTDKALMASLIQFVGDGVLSVAMFITMIFKSLLDHPEEQEKIYKELLEVVGMDRQPTVEDKSKLVYLNAFVMEALRTMEFVTYFPSLQCTKETTLNGYRIPKGSITLMNSWSAHLDPATYEEPEKFDPTRFMSKDGKKKPELPTTFGMGKRSCLGEGYVMLQVFVAIATVIKNFQLALPKDDSLNNYAITGKLFVTAKPRS